MSTLVRDLIKDALEEIGAIAAGETPSATDSDKSLRVLNRMIGSWSNEPLALYKLAREVMELEAGKATYTVGAGGDLVSSRPMEVLGAAYGQVITTPSLKVDLELPIEILNYQQWMGIQQKTLQSGAIRYLYVEGAVPFETLHVWPVPDASLGLVVYSKKELSSFADLDEEVILPPGYEDAIVYNLALRLTTSFGRTLTQELKDLAVQSKASIKRQNTRIPIMKSDAYGISTSSSGCKTGNIFGGS